MEGKSLNNEKDFPGFETLPSPSRLPLQNSFLVFIVILFKET